MSDQHNHPGDGANPYAGQGPEPRYPATPLPMGYVGANDPAGGVRPAQGPSSRKIWLRVMIPLGTFAVGLATGLLIGHWGSGDGEVPEADRDRSGVPIEETAPARQEPVEERTELEEAAPAQDEDAEPSDDPEPVPTQSGADPQSPRSGDVFTFGDRIHFAGMEITYTDVQVTDTVQAVDGGTINAEDGEVLVLLSSQFTNPGPGTVDLSCSGAPDAFIEMFDWDDNEIAPVFDTHRVPGDPECNEQLLVGQDSEWNTLWRGVAGSEPAYLTIHDTNTWDFIAITLHEDVQLVIE